MLLFLCISQTSTFHSLFLLVFKLSCISKSEKSAVLKKNDKEPLRSESEQGIDDLQKDFCDLEFESVTIEINSAVQNLKISLQHHEPAGIVHSSTLKSKKKKTIEKTVTHNDTLAFTNTYLVSHQSFKNMFKILKITKHRRKIRNTEC